MIFHVFLLALNLGSLMAIVIHRGPNQSEPAIDSLPTVGHKNLKRNLDHAGKKYKANNIIIIVIIIVVKIIVIIAINNNNHSNNNQ